MSIGGDLLVRNVSVEAGQTVDVRIVDGRIVEIGARLRASGPVLEGRGGALLPGLHDHHLHLLALAAQLRSVSVAPERVANAQEFAAALRGAGPGWVRATGYDDAVAGPLDRWVLDRIVGNLPVRVQYRTGTLWVLNSAALAQVSLGRRLRGDDAKALVAPAQAGAEDDPLERNAAGVPTGRLWHADAWLRSRVGDAPPPLAPVGALLARFGVTGVTDTSVNTGAQQAALLAEAHRSGALPQRLHLMSGGALAAPDDLAFTVGPVKFHLHEAQLPEFDAVVAAIRQARRWSRCVAFHCVTATELAFVLAALDEAGMVEGDRIEHGAVIDALAAAELAARGLTVVTQPGFIAERGDRYRRDVAPEDLACLYPCASLLRAGVRVAGSTDAPYTSADPWAAMAAAQHRRTRLGRFLGEQETVNAPTALALFLGRLDDPGGAPRQVTVGADADLCLLQVPLQEALRQPDSRHVRATVIGGRVVHDADSLDTQP